VRNHFNLEMSHFVYQSGSFSVITQVAFFEARLENMRIEVENSRIAGNID